MPSVSAKQRRFMAAAAHNPQFAKKAGIPQTVAQEFNRADDARAQQTQPQKRKAAMEKIAKKVQRRRKVYEGY